MTIYDVRSQDEVHFLISEFLHGQSLREVLTAGPVPLRRVSEYGLQIAKGLAAAHDKGIIHRDIKPDNVFVLGDERVKILDFGLAKQASPLVFPFDALCWIARCERFRDVTRREGSCGIAFRI